MSVSFRPAHPGPIVGLLQVRTSAGTRTVPVSGYGSAPGLIRSAPPLNFGEIATHTNGKYLAFTISNSWTRPERITGVHLPGGAYEVSGAPAVGTVLAPRQTRDRRRLLQPLRAGLLPRPREDRQRQGGRHGGPQRPGGQRAPADVTAATHDSTSAPSPWARSRTLRFSIFDAGNVPLEITRAIPPAEPFAADKQVPEGLTIGSRSGLTEAITFTPTATGRFSGQLRPRRQRRPWPPGRDLRRPRHQSSRLTSLGRAVSAPTCAGRVLRPVGARRGRRRPGAWAPGTARLRRSAPAALPAGPHRGARGCSGARRSGRW